MKIRWVLAFGICIGSAAHSAEYWRVIVAQDTISQSIISLSVKGIPKGFEILKAIVRPSWPGLYIFSKHGEVLIAQPIKHNGYGEAWKIEDQLHLDPKYTHDVEDVLMYGRLTYIAQASGTYGNSDHLVYAIERITGRLLGFHLFHRSVYFDGYGNIAWVILREGDAATHPKGLNFDPYGRRFVYQLNSFADSDYLERGPLVDTQNAFQGYAENKVLHTKDWLFRAGIFCGKLLGIL